MSNSENDLIRSAAQIARSSPENWQRFKDALRAYSAERTENLVNAPIDQLPVFQGRAQIAARIYDLLADCIEGADKLERVKK